MDMFSIFLEAFVPIYCLYYGFKTKKNPPKMGQTGFGTKLAMQSQEAWDMANAYGAKLCMIFGAVTAALFILRIVLFGTQMNITFSLFLIAVELVCIISIIPLVNSKVKKTFGNKR